MPYYPPPVAGAVGANPTASVGLTAVNGSALTFMRSDAAPPLDQTAAYTFSGLGATTISQQAPNTSALTIGNVTSTTSAPVINASQTINGAVDATGIFYNLIPGVTPPNTTSPVLQLQYNSGNIFRVTRAGALILSGSVTTGGNVIIPTGNVFNFTGRGGIGSTSDGFVTVTNNNGSATANLGAAANAVLQLGAVNAASPVAQTLQAQGSRAGTDVSTAGANFTHQSGIGTGNVGVSSSIFNGIIGNATTTTTAQTTAAALTIPGVASGQLPGAVIGSAAIATNATDGFLYIPSGAGPPTGTPTAFTGRVPLYYDSTNDQLYIYRTAWKQPKTPSGAAIVNWQ